MQAQLVFAFPVNVSATEAIHAVANHFAVGVSIMGAPANVPAHIKQAVESIGADNPANGVETSPAIAFGSLLNGAAGNAQATPENAQSIAGVATSPTARAANPAISQTTPPASSAPALPTANAAVVPMANAAPASPAGVEFDSTGLPWDERIHSGNKTKTPGGEWRTKKGTDKSLIKNVELELRAKYPNGGASAAASVASATSAIPTATVDPNAAYAYAHTEALRVAGPQLIDDATLSAMNNGQSFTMSIEQSEWYSVYHAKRASAYAAFMAGNVVSAPPVAPASLTPTGNEAVAPAGAPSIPAASPMAAVGTVAPAPTAPHGELDATGLPHDKRIHIAAPLKDAAGVYIQRHDVPGETKLLVMAELRAALAGNVAAQASSTPAAPASTPVAPTPPVVPVISAADAGADFAKMMQWIVANQIAGRITPTAGPEAAKMLGFADANGNGQLALMTQQKDYWPHVVMLLQGQGAV